MTISPITEANFGEAVNLLTQNQLPTSDLSPATVLYGLYDDQHVKGTVGLDTFSTVGLLRSLCISNDLRKEGYGQQLVKHIEEEAKKKGIQELYLLTTTAANFFVYRKYQIIDRSSVPEPIQQTPQFSTICSKTATIMKKELI